MRVHLKKRKIPFALMLAVNSFLAVLVISFILFYVKKSNDESIAEAMRSTKDSVATMTAQYENQLKSFHAVGQSYAYYIEGEHLSLEEAKKFLVHWKSVSKELVLVDADTLESWSIGGEQDAFTASDYGQREWVQELCSRFDEIHQYSGQICVSPVYQDETTGEALLGFYKAIVIENRNYLHLFVTPVTNFHVYGLNVDQGFVINEEGFVLNGNERHLTGYEGMNYYEYLKEQYGAEKSEEVRLSILNNQEGEFNLLDSAGTEWVCSYRAIDIADGWAYIYHENMEELRKQHNSLRLVVLSCIFMGIWLLLDVSMYIVYSKKLQKSLKIIEEQNEDLMFANQAKTSFVSNISHEIRTPINAVLGMDEMIIRECGDEKIRSYAYDIRNAGNVLLEIINDVLDFSKIESGKLEIVPKEYSLTNVINDIHKMVELKAKSKYLELKLQVDPQIPDKLYGDEIRIKQIVINLLTNAIKYTNEGSVTIVVNFVKLTEEQIELKVSVQDTGIGIKADELDKLFAEYSRLDTKRNRRIEGTGLGLSIVKRLLEMMDSRIEVESVYGLGSKFFFSLKQNVVSWEPVGEEVIKKKQQETTLAPGILKASKARILAVDDTKVNLMVVKGLLKRTGIQVDTAEDGLQCLEMAEKKKYDLILLDHRMPKMDGIETIHKLRSAKGGLNRSTPVIALTANVVSGAKEMYIKEGFNDFLPKPINSSNLEKVILDYLPPECLDAAESDCGEIDQQAGIIACGGEDIYREVKEVFNAQSREMIEKIRKYHEQRDIKNYITLVHGLKSSARLLGAMQLSEEAFELEKSAKLNDWNAIDAGTDTLLRHYEMIANKINSL